MHLKSKNGPLATMKFAILMEPSLEGVADDDESMYAAITAHGKAVVAVFSDNLITLNEPTTLTPREFETTWRGD